MQQIGEGRLAIPVGWHDATVNIYTAEQPGARGLSVTVNRDRLPVGTTLEDYVKAQTQRLQAELRQFHLLAQEHFRLHGAVAHLLEFTWLSKDVGEIHQMLMTTVVDQKVLNFAGTSPGRMEDRQRAELLRLLKSFQPNPSPSQ